MTSIENNKPWYKDAPESYWESLIAFCATFFMVLFAYPFARVTAESIYINSFGAKATPVVWLYSVITLSVVMFFYNMSYKKIGVKMSFIYTSIFSAVFFLLAGYLVGRNGFQWLAYPIYILKEVYIILLLHLAIGYFNENNTQTSAKMLLSLIGGVGSVGGILGGILVKKLNSLESIGADEILMIGSIPIIIASIIFYFVDFSGKIIKTSPKETIKSSPLKSIENVSFYVTTIVIVLVLSQFIMNLAGFKFNIMIGDLFPNKSDKTDAIANVYVFINLFALFMQIAIIPLLLYFVHISKIHIIIPTIYLISITIGIFAVGSYISLMATFIILKGTDYSLFNAAKELLFYPLKKAQKTGAKYLVDMIAYRAAKGLIAFILIYYQTDSFIKTAFILCFIAWFIALYFMFRERSKIIKLNNIKAENE